MERDGFAEIEHILRTTTTWQRDIGGTVIDVNTTDGATTDYPDLVRQIRGSH
ncbi:MAG: hypothetical protein NVSMB52_14180 [Chloroflexota bacterium]